MLLKGRVAIVTGGTGDIGETIVKKFVAEGCAVAFTFSTNKASAAKMTKWAGGKAKGYRVDIKNLAEMKKLTADVKHKFKRLDVLVNNAGITRDKSLMMMEQSDWDDVIDINLKGAFNATRACIVTFMKQRRGSIINISSISAIIGLPGQTNYAASKAGIIGFTKALSKEVGPYNIRVNAVAPGFVQTDMIERLKNKEKILNSTPLRRFGNVSEIAELVLFLAADKSSYITGQTIIIDGGLV